MRALRLLPLRARRCGRLLLHPKTLYPNLPSPRRRPRYWMCLSKSGVGGLSAPSTAWPPSAPLECPIVEPTSPPSSPIKQSVADGESLVDEEAPANEEPPADEKPTVHEELPADEQLQADEEQPVDEEPSADENSSSGEESSADEELPAKKEKGRKGKPTKASDVSAEVNIIVANNQFPASLTKFHDNSPTIIQCCQRMLAEQMSLRVEDLEYIEFVKLNPDTIMLKRASPHRNNEHLCMGWLVLQFHPNARSTDGMIDEDEYKCARSKIAYKIGAGEHLMCFEETLGAEVFLLFAKS
ncbi:hypothetical protein IWZ03DRAFT_357117 [Phyllosticta citriasiana]|uniref:Uncharacterized protein n=1 Tax=Phyllosticta citriasiana TaxID=595635 RepID=A0ABR1KTF5_9PEZI